MDILITGGAGFIGSHLCQKLSEDNNNRVHSLDNYSTGTQRNHVKNVHYIKGDTKDIDRLVNFKPDMIYHLGEYSRVEQSFDEINKVWQYNIIGTFAVLEFARKSKCKILYAGSSTKFSKGISNKETSPYAWTKATNTELVVNYGHWFNIPYAITYFYNVYGKREIESGKYATLIAIFAKQMAENKPLTVVSPGIQKRNFTHIDDVISGLILVGESGYGDEFGIGSHQSFTIKEIAQMFGGNIQLLPERKGNRMDANVITKKTKQLGWRETKNIKEYIVKLRRFNWQNKDES